MTVSAVQNGWVGSANKDDKLLLTLKHQDGKKAEMNIYSSEV